MSGMLCRGGRYRYARTGMPDGRGAPGGAVRARLRPVRGVQALLTLCAALGALCTPDVQARRSDVPGPAPAPLPQVYALRPPDLFYHAAGALRLMVTNVGMLGNPHEGVDSFGAGWRDGEYLHTAELWVGAVASDNMEHVSSGFEFRPSLGPGDTIYRSHEGAPGGGRWGFSSYGGDDDGDGQRDEEFLNGRDDDGDGLIDEDFEAISQEMFCCEYWDHTTEAMQSMPDHRPLYVRVRQRSFAWSEDGYDDFIGLDLEIINEGFESLRDLYVGWLVDADIGRIEGAGYWRDDLGAADVIDTSYVNDEISYICRDRDGIWHDCNRERLRFDIVCMRDAHGSEGGQYGDDLPADRDGWLGVMLLDQTTDETGERAPRRVAFHTRTFVTRRWGYDYLDHSRYQWLAGGQWQPDSVKNPSDYAMMLSIGPFPEVMPGERLRGQWVLVVGPGWKGLRQNAVAARRVWRGRWRDADHDPETGVEGRERCLRVEPGQRALIWRDPCVQLGDVLKVKSDDCSIPDVWVDDDCDCCTPVQDPEAGRWGCESLVRWVARVAPPPPTVSTENPQRNVYLTGDRTVRIEWDNAPELAVDPWTNTQRFCGYRIWRVEGWTRPLGAPGPESGDWHLLADLAPEPVGSQLDLAEHTNAFARVIEYVSIEGDTLGPRPRYEVGRYFFDDTKGLKNGMLYFYDVTSYACWIDDEDHYHEIAQPPAALECEGVRPRCDAVGVEAWRDRLAVVPNPYRGGAAWDLNPNSADPLGTHISFIGLPDRDCTIRIYTLAGDLVQTLQHTPWRHRGELQWDLISRNHQPIVSGVYLYAVRCGQEQKVGRFTVIR